MKIDSIQAENFMSHRDTVLDVTIGQRVQIAGENGSGKTSAAVDALLWCLFKKSRSTGPMEQNRGPWGPSMKVTARFQVKGHDYEVVRSSGGKSELEFRDLTSMLDLSEKHVAMTQSKIVELIGSYESFVNTAIFRQGDALRFGFMRPEERRTLFEELLNLQVYADIESAARKGRTASSGSLETIAGRLEQMDVWETELTATRAELDGVETALSSATTALNDEQAALDAASSELLQMEEAQQRRNSLAAGSAAEERKLLSAKAGVVNANAELTRLHRYREDLKVSICPTCKQALNADEVGRQKIENKQEIEQAEARLQEAQKAMKLAEEGWAKTKVELDALDLDISTRFKQARELQQYSSARLPGLRRGVEEQRSCYDQLKGKIATLEANLADKEKLELERADQQSRVRGYELISEAFSKRGIPRELMRGFASEVEKATNALLQSLGGASVEIKLDKDGATKHGVTEGTVDVWFTDAGPTRKVEMLSGGEKMRAMTALRLGIAQAMARRTDKSIRTLILDESLDGLDQKGKDDMMTMLGSFESTSFDRMLFISHDPAIAGLFPERIELAKATDGATVVL